MLTSPLRCPKCGQPLRVLVAAPTVAPWHCDPCGLSWFNSEVTAREKWNRAWAWSNPVIRAQVAKGVQEELAAAQGRGTSLREDQLALAHRSVLDTLLPKLRGEFATMVAGELQKRGTLGLAEGAA